MRRHSFAQRLQACAHSWQWGCWCLAHSSPQASQICAHVPQTDFANVLPRAMKPAAIRQTAAQSISKAMQFAIIFTSSSCRQAVAQWSQASAHALQASMQEA